MRKRTFIFAALLLAVGIFAYIKTSNKEIVQQDKFYLAITNNCTEEIYGIRYEYSLNNTLVEGGIVNANGTVIEAGNALTIEITPTSFHIDNDISGFSIEFFVILEDDKEISCGSPMQLNVTYGESYELLLGGNRVNGFHIILK